MRKNLDEIRRQGMPVCTVCKALLCVRYLDVLVSFCAQGMTYMGQLSPDEVIEPVNIDTRGQGLNHCDTNSIFELPHGMLEASSIHYGSNFRVIC